jgi:transposase
MSKSRKPYPLEYRQRVIDLVRSGRSPEELAREFEPTAQCIRNWMPKRIGMRGGALMGSPPTSAPSCSA